MAKDHFEKYGNLQRVKHELIRRYVNGWLPKLATGNFGNSKVIYFDTHAGRGRFKTGEKGSPIVALTAIRDHKCLPDVKGEIYCAFIEKDDANVKALEKEIELLGELPENVKVFVSHGDSFELLTEICDKLDKDGSNLAPSLIFCDPFTFDIDLEVLVRLMKHRSVEVFVNVIWRFMSLGLAHAFKGSEAWSQKFDKIFGGNQWRELQNFESSDGKVGKCAEIIKDRFAAKHHTFIKMLAGNNSTTYFLLHLTNHDKGKIEMKNAIWAVCPEGGYFASQKDNLSQPLLIEPEPDLSNLYNWIVETLLESGGCRWHDLSNKLIDEIWLDKHLRKVLSQMRKQDEVIATEFSGMFCKGNNPFLSMKS